MKIPECARELFVLLIFGMVIIMLTYVMYACIMLEVNPLLWPPLVRGLALFTAIGTIRQALK